MKKQTYIVRIKFPRTDKDMAIIAVQNATSKKNAVEHVQGNLRFSAELQDSKK